MGEYIEIKRQPVKIGTCEDLYYMRYEDLKKVIPYAKHIPGNLEPSEYLNPAHGFRYRFPFPEEDDYGPGNYAKYDHGLLVFLHDDLAPGLLKSLPTWAHYDLTHYAAWQGAFHVNIFTSCVLSENPPERMTEPSRAVIISQQKQVEGELWTVIACPYCNAKVRLDRNDAAELAACARLMAKDEQDSNFKYWSKVANRIMAGYNQENE